MHISVSPEEPESIVPNCKMQSICKGEKMHNLSNIGMLSVPNRKIQSIYDAEITEEGEFNGLTIPIAKMGKYLWLLR